MTELWHVDVARRLDGARGPKGDRATIYQLEEGEGKVTGRLKHLPPVENNVSWYGGTFASRDEAVAAVRETFPAARIKS